MKLLFPINARFGFPLAALVLAAPPADAAILYWDGAGTWNAAGNWSLVPGAPFNQAWNSGDDAVFNVASSTITGSNTVFNSITANENVTMTAAGTLQPLYLADITVAAGKTFNFGTQLLGGFGGIRKLGAGSMVFGNAANNFSGGFTIEAGSVSFSNASALGSGGGPLVLNGGSLQGPQGTADLSNRFSEITIGGNIVLASAITFNAPMNLGDAVRTINVGGFNNFNGKISGEPGAGFTKEGGSFLALRGNNDFSGPVIHNDGYLVLAHNNALGTTEGDTTINGRITETQINLSYAPVPGLTIAENFNFRSNADGPTSLFSSAFSNDTAPRNHTFSGAINVTSQQNIVDFVSEANSITFTGNITGTMTLGAGLRLGGSSGSPLNRVLGDLILIGCDLVKTGSGTWLLGAPGKTYAWNNTRVANGTLKLGLANLLPSSGLLIMGNTEGGKFGGNDGFLDLNGFDQTVAGITYVGGANTQWDWFTGTRRITSATPALLTVNNATDFSPGLTAPSTKVVLEGALSLRKEGSGKLTLSGANTNTGLTIVAGGTLAFVGGSQASPITVNAFASLGFTLGSPTTSTNTLDFYAGSSVNITGTPDADTSYTLLTTTATISGPTPLLDPPIPGFQLQIDGFKTLKLVPATGSAYDSWAATKGLTGAPGFENSKAADPDGDGKTNLYEFAFDGDPLSPANDGKIVGKVAPVGAVQAMTLTLPVRNTATFSADSGDQLSALIDGIYYRIEGGTDLINFADTISEVTPAITAGLPGLSSDWTYRTFRAPGTVPTVLKAFLRAKASETP